MIEEMDTLPPAVRSVAYTQAREWLADRQSPDTKPRLKAARRKIGGELLRKAKIVDVREVLFNKRCDLEDEVLKYERDLIRRTLAKVNGQVTDAAKLLNVGRQRLAQRIETKHPDLLKERTPVHRRRSRKAKHIKRR
jgi:DNA-binding NtrC family response regulator